MLVYVELVCGFWPPHTVFSHACAICDFSVSPSGAPGRAAVILPPKAMLRGMCLNTSPWGDVQSAWVLASTYKHTTLSSFCLVALPRHSIGLHPTHSVPESQLPHIPGHAWLYPTLSVCQTRECNIRVHCCVDLYLILRDFKRCFICLWAMRLPFSVNCLFVNVLLGSLSSP